MPVLVVMIIISLAFYVYYKVKAYRSQKPIEKQWISAKSSIALGIFVASFGLNQLFLYRSSISLIVGIIFLLIGLGSSWAGFRAYKHYLPQVINESGTQK
ncbi:YtpI family protein [uncultured Metabacillus sp.]|uniref:YtpI family protein n=1 Tax=Metabacillus sp. Hm71 TaxID=3450743 RepID=UPI00262D7E1E|nr:YtpI family protein [uncultured Metabacillus sp.]